MSCLKKREKEKRKRNRKRDRKERKDKREERVVEEALVKTALGCVSLNAVEKLLVSGCPP